MLNTSLIDFESHQDGPQHGEQREQLGLHGRLHAREGLTAEGLYEERQRKKRDEESQRNNSIEPKSERASEREKGSEIEQANVRESGFQGRISNMVAYYRY